MYIQRTRFSPHNQSVLLKLFVAGATARAVVKIIGWSATQKLIRYGGDFSGKMSLKEGGGFCHEKEA